MQKSRITVFFVLFILHLQYLTAQTSDLQLSELLNKQDYWALNEQYPLLKKQASRQFQLYTEAMLNHFFNKPEQSNENIQEILTDYPDWLPIEVQNYLALTVAANALNMQDYAKAASIYGQYIEQMESYLDSSSMAAYKSAYKLYKSLENTPPISVVYGQKQTNIPLSKDTFGLLTLPVMIGKEKSNMLNFTLDFGASLSVIEEKYVDGINIRILSDSISINNPYGSFDGYTKFGVAEEIYLGDILVKNVIFIIYPDRIIDVYPENEMNAILGLPILQALENLQISSTVLSVSSVSKPSKFKPNMLIFNSSLFVHAKSSKNKSLRMHFDSGSDDSHLNKNYLSENQEDVGHFIADSIHKAALGGIQKIGILKMPHFSCKIGNKKLHFSSMYIEMADYLSGYFPIDGVLGLDLITQHKKVIVIDFKNMYFQIK